MHVHIERTARSWGWFSSPTEKWIRDGGVFIVGESIAGWAHKVETVYMKSSWQGGHKIRGWANVSGPRREHRLLELEEAGLASTMEETVEDILASLV